MMTDLRLGDNSLNQSPRSPGSDRQLLGPIAAQIAGVEQFYQVKRMIRGIGDALSSTYSQTLDG